MLLSLIDVAKEKGATERTNSYWNAFYCCVKYTEHNNRLHVDYCKTRFCTICNAIRKEEYLKVEVIYICIDYLDYFLIHN